MAHFPFSPPSTSEERPDLAQATPATYGTWADALEWTLTTRGGSKVAADAPVRRWIDSLRRHASGASVHDVPLSSAIAVGGSQSPENLAAVCDFVAACFAGHAALRLEGEHASGRVAQLAVSENFVLAELGARDRSELNFPALAAGVGTLLAAAECARLGAQRIEIFGSDSPALDVEWEPLGGGLVRIESKWRAFASAFDRSATPRHLAKWALEKVAEAGPKLRARCKRDRVRALQVVRITGFAPRRLAEEVQHLPDWDALVNAALLPQHPADALNPYLLPHGVVVHWIGIDDGDRSGWENRPRFMDVALARPRPNSESIAAFHALVGRPADAPPGLRPRL